MTLLKSLVKVSAYPMEITFDSHGSEWTISSELLQHLLTDLNGNWCYLLCAQASFALLIMFSVHMITCFDVKIFNCGTAEFDKSLLKWASHSCESFSLTFNLIVTDARKK